MYVGGRELGRLAIGTPTRLVRRPGLLVSQAEIEGQVRRRLGELRGVVEWGREVAELAPDAEASPAARERRGRGRGLGGRLR
ncbi:MAG: hypothetical protein M3228_04640 [Actinomycetota bacterium]|nr:hypothetical protein [Actinomycetota bacterium]